MISKKDFRQLVGLWMSSDKNPDAAAISLWKAVQPRVVASVEMLETLPHHTLIHTADGDFAERIYEYWFVPGTTFKMSDNQITLPVTVLSEPAA